MTNKKATYANQVETRLRNMPVTFKNMKTLFCLNGLLSFTISWCYIHCILKRYSLYTLYFEKGSPKFLLIRIALLGPETVSTPSNLVIHCCYQDPTVVNHAVQKRF